ncbi:bifunctional 3-phenylpropionate/cinnamic acid dioxygenase ferredoxin subunit [Fodinicola acaciae]|uniref:bifunctional 3-phenylpropionate/cinnamic acid dioxygenase ferredoxin subunit n=1 Tax=Fodinicola acaciae TaxID=2681555 RepID=UPI0013D47B21|nr:bifunctional 3-phenylpropionate/cinnamic acid dioxygenase ferredoxin subunit [Fodinicola acaciae]
MTDFVRACAAAEVPAGEATGVDIDGTPVAIVHTEDGEFFAIRDVCSHAEVPLSEGDVEGCTIECWLHGSQFDLRTGKPTGLPATEPVPTYPTRVADGDVFVNISATQESVK